MPLVQGLWLLEWVHFTSFHSPYDYRPKGHATREFGYRWQTHDTTTRVLISLTAGYLQIGGFGAMLLGHGSGRFSVFVTVLLTIR